MNNAAPELTPVGVLRVEVAPPVELDVSPLGRRRFVAVLGGTLEGKLGTGVVLPGGADWQTVHDDGGVSIDARYAIRLDDEVVITLRSIGVRAPQVDGSGVLFRTAIQLTAPGARADLNRSLYVSSGVRADGIVRLDLYRLT